MNGTLDAIELQILLGALRAACEEMGATLIRSAHSANIKERRDASTALFDPRGQMIMQAEHIPVHLGAMPAAVQEVLEQPHAAGRSWILNDPFAGGTHLPDITLITPVFAREAPAEGSGELLGFAASRAHHADVGGRLPGSMPADSRTLEEEGVVIPPTPLEPGTLAELVRRMRQPEERLADLRAQQAANRIGALRLRELADRLGIHRLQAGTAAVQDYAEQRTRTCLAEIPDCTLVREDFLEAIEGDLTLRLRAEIAGERLLLDFAGSDAQHAGNLNCPLAVTRSACYFALRVLTDPDIPPCAGAYRPLQLHVPRGVALERPTGSCGRGRQRRDLLARRGPRAGRVRASARTGDDEQPHAGERGLQLLRDRRRRPRSLPGPGRPERRPRGDEQHAQHPGRGPRA